MRLDITRGASLDEIVAEMDRRGRVLDANAEYIDRLKAVNKDCEREITRLRAENERLAAKNKEWRERDDAIRAEFGGKRDGRATIECLREAFAAKWSEEDALFQATLDMNTKELRAENEQLRVALIHARQCILDWGSYAPDHFKAKWNFDGDLTHIDNALAQCSAGGNR